MRETVPRGQPPPPLDRRLSARLLGCLSLVEERQSSAEWHRDLLAVELACVLACVLLATVSLLQAGDVLEGLDGHDGVVKAINAHGNLSSIPIATQRLLSAKGVRRVIPSYYHPSTYDCVRAAHAVP